MLLVFGGYTGSEFLSSVESFVDGQWAMMESNLPTTVYQHCVVQFEDFAMVIAGIQVSWPQNIFYLRNKLILCPGYHYKPNLIFAAKGLI